MPGGETGFQEWSYPSHLAWGQVWDPVALDTFLDATCPLGEETSAEGTFRGYRQQVRGWTLVFSYYPVRELLPPLVLARGCGQFRGPSAVVASSFPLKKGSIPEH